MAWIEKRVQGDLTNWRVLWREAGKRQWETFDDEPAAASFKLHVEADGNRCPRGWVRHQGWADEFQSGAPMFRDFAEQTITARRKADSRTQADYLGMLRNHINPVIGDLPVDRVDRFAVAKVADRAIKAGRSAKTIANIHGLLSSILTDAVGDELIRRNPAIGAMPDVPDVRTEEMVFLSPADFARLLSFVPEFWQPLVRLLVGTGLRWSEATALQVQDVDLLNRKALQVRRAWKYRDGYFELGEPKTKRARRTVSLSPELIDLLVPYVATGEPKAFVFTTTNGRPVRHANFYLRVWLPAVFDAQNCDAHRQANHDARRAYELEVRSAKRAKRERRLTAPPACGCSGTLVAAPRIHDLRHTHASWLLDEKITLPAIQRRLGHESIQTTIDRYSHLAPDHVDEINAAVDRALTRL